MSKSKFTEHHIAFNLKQYEACVKVADLGRLWTLGIEEQVSTFMKH